MFPLKNLARKGLITIKESNKSYTLYIWLYQSEHFTKGTSFRIEKRRDVC